MDIMVKGKDMPKCCGDCWALEDYGDYPLCRITQEQRGYTFPVRNSRMDKCPLVPVPSHGRLIDADELEKTFPPPDDYNAPEKTLYHVTGVWARIAAAPTIIPAEKKGE